MKQVTGTEEIRRGFPGGWAFLYAGSLLRRRPPHRGTRGSVYTPSRHCSRRVWLRVCSRGESSAKPTTASRFFTWTSSDISPGTGGYVHQHIAWVAARLFLQSLRQPHVPVPPASRSGMLLHSPGPARHIRLFYRARLPVEPGGNFPCKRDFWNF